MCNANEQMNQTDCFSNMKWGGMMQVFPRCSKDSSPITMVTTHIQQSPAPIVCLAEHTSIPNMPPDTQTDKQALSKLTSLSEPFC